jgi:manganese transport protein
MFVPQFAGGGSALLAASIVGATVMPHVIYLHSSLTQNRIVGAHPAARRKIFRFEVIDVGLAMGIAGVINLAMLATAAAVFNARGLPGAGNDLGQIASGMNRFLGTHAGTIFGVALLVSGIASSSVGTLSGQLVMQGFIHRQIPVFLRRAVTVIPALAVIIAGFSPSRALVLSQVFLAFGIPFALVPLIAFTKSQRIMGLLVNRRLTNLAAYGAAGMIIALNVYLLT